MKILTSALALFLISAASIPQDVPCLEPGDCGTIDFERPALGDVGDPVSAEYLDTGTYGPIAMENDQHGANQSENDPMGDASPDADDPETRDDESQTGASVEVCNDGGVLEGPNGEGLNGGIGGWVEEGCVEVEVCWRYKYTKTRTTAIESSTGQITGYVSVDVVAHGIKCSDWVEICEC